MASLRDGMGGEEVQISGLQAGGTNVSPYWTGSITTESQVSGLNIFAAGSSTSGRIATAAGAMFPANVGSAGAVGGKVQAGTLVTNAGSTGFAVFREPFANGGYKIALTPGSSNGIVAVTSGTRAAGSCTVIGTASARYDFVAVGL